MKDTASIDRYGQFYLDGELQYCPIANDNGSMGQYCSVKCARFAIRSRHIEGRKVWFINCCGIVHMVKKVIVNGKEQV